MDDVLLPNHLRARGIAADDWARMAARGDLDRLRRGAFREPGADQQPVNRHRQLITANLAYVSERSVISHASAAVLHGLPVWDSDLSVVHLTRSRSFGGRVGPYVHRYPAPLNPAEITVIDGVAVTSLARTVLDLSRHSSLKRGVAVADAALAKGLTHEELDEVAGWSRRRPGMVRARRAVALADGRSESVGESFSRVTYVLLGLPPTHLQYEVFDSAGFFIGRTDFCWEDRHTLGEFDGRIKYGRLVPAGRAPGDVVFDEKRREDELRATGREVVRWTFDDLANPRRLAATLERAFARADCRH